MLKWTSSLFFHTGHVMCSLFFLFDSYFIWNTPKTTKNCWPSPHWKYVNLQPLLLGLFHGSNGLYLLKSISINFVWIHTGHVMCSLAHLDFFIWNTPQIIQNWPIAHTESMDILRHFLASSMDPMDWNTSVSVLYGSIQDMWCVVWPIWIFLSSERHPKQPRTGP